MRIHHPTQGQGTVLSQPDEVLVVEFDNGAILKVLQSEVREIVTPEQALLKANAAKPLDVATTLLGHAIRSTSDRWGVFSRSRVKLLPHQLWVAHRVLQRWPSRWLVADDVGLGKTIEAGLILSPLLARRAVQRLLVLTPASLAEQWQTRLKDMFDIRSSRYNPEVDKPSADYWNAHRVVVASMHTLRLDHKKRWERILESDPWDLVVVDEAHHLNDSERGKPTLALELLRQMDQQRLIGGMLLFTGTPHRGKDRGFLSLLALLDPAHFHPKMRLEAALPHLASVVIRNNKGTVTDMRGDRLFQPSTVHDDTYTYSPAEQEFYDQLTHFILSGRAFAESMQLNSQRTVMLVLITLQKLAASSVAAVASALRKRLARLTDVAKPGQVPQIELDVLWARLQRLTEEGGPEDEVQELQRQIDEKMAWLQVSADEVPSLQELVATAMRVERESRLDVLQQLIASRPPGTTFLIFTEYKATQSLIVGELGTTFGWQTVSFINGDGFLEVASHPSKLIKSSRLETASDFQSGKLRFLVSTEAAGEGIDLQQNCHTLVHYDLPWNPMRMHQRVGRLNRYGQTHPVDIHLMRNPETVEGRIWSRLLEKLDRIALAFSGVQAAPEDIHALVLGAAPPTMLANLISGAANLPADQVDSWFDAQSATLGGEEVTSAVAALIGHTAKFDFGIDAPSIPKLDLPDLLPFLRAALRVHNKRLMESEAETYNFETPQAWRGHKWLVRERYDGFHFRREAADKEVAKRLLGTGVLVIEAALATACDGVATVAVTGAVTKPLYLYMVVDNVHSQDVAFNSAVLAVHGDGEDATVLVDWEAVALLNAVVERPDRDALQEPGQSYDSRQVVAGEELARQRAALFVPAFRLPFRRPVLRFVGALLPRCE